MRLVGLLAIATAAAVVLSGDGLAARQGVPETEVVVTLKGAPLAAFGRSLLSARHAGYAGELAAGRRRAERNVLAAVPGAGISWRYHLVADGFSVVLPKAEVPRLEALPGLQVWPSLTYHSLVDQGPATIGANQLWGPSLASAGQGMKIAILDDGIEAEIRRRIREDCSPRHVPDAVLAAPEIPRTLSGKILEVPVKRLLMGAPPDQVASRDSLANPEALDWFAGLTARRG